MPKSANQKKKLLYLQKILLEKTDDAHAMTVNELKEALAARPGAVDFRPGGTDCSYGKLGSVHCGEMPKYRSPASVGIPCSVILSASRNISSEYPDGSATRPSGG